MPELRPDRLAELEQEARSALRTSVRTREIADAALTVEHGGLSNHAWTTADPDGGYFVRLSPPDAARLGVDRASECELLQIVAQAGLAPEVVRCDPSRRLLVTRRVPGRPPTRAQAVEPRFIERLGRALRILHGIAVPRGMRRVDFAAQAERLEAQCPAGLDVAGALRDEARRAFAALGRSGRVDALCHNDLHHLNLVDGERLWIVDWEYGGAGDPVFDLASFLCQHDCGPPERELLRQACGGDGTFDPARLDAACWAFDYVQWLWYRAWPACEGADPIYAGHAAALERRLQATAPA